MAWGIELLLGSFGAHSWLVLAAILICAAILRFFVILRIFVISKGGANTACAGDAAEPVKCASISLARIYFGRVYLSRVRKPDL